MDDIDLKVAGVEVSGWEYECGRGDGVAGNLHDICFDITPRERNDGADPSRGGTLESSSDRSVATHDIPAGLAGGAETTLARRFMRCSGYPCRVTYNIPTRQNYCVMEMGDDGWHVRPVTCGD